MLHHSEMPTAGRLRLCAGRAAAGVPCGIRAQHASKSIAAAEFCMDEVAVSAQRFAQYRDLKPEVAFRHDDARPRPVHELLSSDVRAVSLQSDQQEIEGARAEFDWDAIGEQMPLSQKNAERPNSRSALMVVPRHDQVAP